MSLRVSTLVAAMLLPSVRGVPLPVTVTGSSSKTGACACDGDAMRENNAQAAARPAGASRKSLLFMVTEGHDRHPRLLPRRLGPHDARLVDAHRLLAGIRAGGATLATFPEVKSPPVVCAQERKL